jgi:hypothetical protein
MAVSASKNAATVPYASTFNNHESKNQSYHRETAHAVGASYYLRVYSGLIPPSTDKKRAVIACEIRHCTREVYAENCTFMSVLTLYVVLQIKD